MPGFHVDVTDGPINDLMVQLAAAQGRLIHIVCTDERPWGLKALRHGMKSGATSLALHMELPGGYVLLAETSLNAWMLATSYLRSTFEEEITQPGWVALPEPLREVLTGRIRARVAELMEANGLEPDERLAGLAATAALQAMGKPEEEPDA